MNQKLRLKSFFVWSAWGLLLVGAQTTLWPLLFGGVAAPQLWLNLILYFILFRSRIKALGVSYALALFLHPFTSLSLGVFALSLFLIVPVASLIKERTFWPGPRFSAMASFGLVIGWHLSSAFVARIFEGVTVDLHILSRLTELVLTPLVAIPQLAAMQAIDKFLEDEPAPQFNEAPHE